MAKGTMNRVLLSLIVYKYFNERKSIPAVSNEVGLSASTVRRALIKSGCKPRDRREGIILSIPIRISTKGIKRKPFTETHKMKLKLAAISRGEKTAKGISLKPSGYLEVTRGENKFRGEHRVIVENHLGRGLKKYEVVHHIDGNKTNNDISNLMIMDSSFHAYLHAIQNNKTRKRLSNGRYT